MKQHLIFLAACALVLVFTAGSVYALMFSKLPVERLYF